MKPLAFRQYTKMWYRRYDKDVEREKKLSNNKKYGGLKMCMKYLVNSEMLGKRITGYIFYNADNKEFVGMTEKAIKDTLAKGDRLYGLVLSAEGEIQMDKDGFKTTNYMVRSGINSLAPVNESDCAANIFYVVVSVKKVQGGENIYTVINSRYARLEMTESKVKMLLEFGAIQGGVYLDGKGKLMVCEGVQVIETGEGVA